MSWKQLPWNRTFFSNSFIHSKPSKGSWRSLSIRVSHPSFVSQVLSFPNAQFADLRLCLGFFRVEKKTSGKNMARDFFNSWWITIWVIVENYVYTYNIYVMPTMPTTNGCVYMLLTILEWFRIISHVRIQSTTKVNGTEYIWHQGSRYNIAMSNHFKGKGHKTYTPEG